MQRKRKLISSLISKNKHNSCCAFYNHLRLGGCRKFWQGHHYCDGLLVCQNLEERSLRNSSKIENRYIDFQCLLCSLRSDEEGDQRGNACVSLLQVVNVKKLLATFSTIAACCCGRLTYLPNFFSKSWRLEELAILTLLREKLTTTFAFFC